MHAVKLWGGLGNQMFQYAFGKYLETIRHEEVFYYSIPYDSELFFNIKNFRVNLNYLPFDHLKKNLILNPLEYNYRAERKMVQKFPFINPRLYVENSPGFTSEIKQGAVLFDGYWQSYRYFEDISDLISEEYQPVDNLCPGIDRWIDKISSCNSVSVHIRRGDYLSKKNQRLFARCDQAYFNRAIDKINSIVPEPCYFIFSDQIKSISSEMGIFNGGKYNIVDNSAIPNSMVADFILMSHCKHHIISNSTFSWWAAWLNRNMHKIIVSPKQWYIGKLNETTRDLIPGSWIRV